MLVLEDWESGRESKLTDGTEDECQKAMGYIVKCLEEERDYGGVMGRKANTVIDLKWFEEPFADGQPTES